MFLLVHIFNNLCATFEVITVFDLFLGRSRQTSSENHDQPVPAEQNASSARHNGSGRRHAAGGGSEDSPQYA